MTGETPSSGPRVEPMVLSDLSEEAKPLFEPLGELGANSNFFRTLIHNPRVFKRWVPYSIALLHGSLPERDRELLVLRAAHRCGSAYEWEHHLSFARAAGLSDDEIERVRQGGAAAGWGTFDALLLHAADELIDSYGMKDATWETLAERYDERQMIEVPMLVGVYYAMGITLNSLGVAVEDEVR